MFLSEQACQLRTFCTGGGDSLQWRAACESKVKITCQFAFFDVCAIGNAHLNIFFSKPPSELLEGTYL